MMIKFKIWILLKFSQLKDSISGFNGSNELAPPGDIVGHLDIADSVLTTRGDGFHEVEGEHRPRVRERSFDRSVVFSSILPVQVFRRRDLLEGDVLFPGPERIQVLVAGFEHKLCV